MIVLAPRTSAQAAGAATSMLPGDALALFSVQGLRNNVVSAVNQCEKIGLVNASIKKIRSYVVPFIAPIQHISGSAGTTKDGKFNMTTVIVDVGS